jgi:outer membrane protein OmpA-like peptidoglycan-associated protein
VWVSESGLNQVQEIQISTDTIINTVPLAAASNPWGIVNDGTHVWVAASGNNNVAEIADTPHLTPSTLPDGTVGVPYSQALTISGGTGPYTVTCSGTPPTGLTVTPSGTGVLISGTPTVAGPDANAVNCTVTDANTATSTTVIPITIDAAVVTPTTPALTPTALPDGTVGSGYSQSLSVTGGTAPFVIVCSLSTPPAGLSVTVTPSSPATIPASDTGVLISGTPTTTGTDSNAVNCTVTDSTGRTSSSIIPITIDAAVVVTPAPTPATPAVVVAPTLTVGPASGVTTTSATLNGTVNPNGTAINSEDFCYIEGSTLIDCAGATTVAIVPATLPASTTVTSLAAMAATLYANSPYCYQLEATNVDGTYYSTPVCFSTSATATAAVVTPAVILPGGLRYITHFGENLYSLTASDLVTIHALAVFIKTHADTHDALIGYTDPLNTKSYNLALGERRANAVAVQLEKDLMAMGVHNVSSATASGGATNYVVVGLSNSARAKDRRVTISVN